VAAAEAAAQIAETDAAPMEYQISAVTGARHGKYQVLWDDGSKTWEPLSEDKVLSVWRDPERRGWDYLIGNFIIVEFSKSRKYLGRVDSYNKKMRKYRIVYEDGHDNGDLDLLAAEKAWLISDQTF